MAQAHMSPEDIVGSTRSAVTLLLVVVLVL
jgi:hypothetical protein